MAADVGKIYPADIHLLRKEIEVQGELLAQERFERKAEIDRLKIQIETLKRLLEETNPGFLARYRSAYPRERESFDPEMNPRDK